MVDRNSKKKKEFLMTVYLKAERIIHRVILDASDKKKLKKKTKEKKKSLTENNNHYINRQKEW